MKNKTKLLLSLSVLTAASIAAGTAGTFAWFTTTRTAELSFQKATVVSNQSSLKVSANNSDWAGNTTVTNNKYITDVSSKDGKSFVKASFSALGVVNNSSAYSSTTGTEGDPAAYIDYTFYVKGTQADSLNVYVSASSVTVADFPTAPRIAVFVDNTAGDPKLILDAGGAKYLNGTTLDNLASSIHLPVTGYATTSEPAGKTADTHYLCTVSGTVTKTIIYRLWFEGTNFSDVEFPAIKPEVTSTLSLIGYAAA